MKAVIRLALPALNTLTPDSLLPFALLDRQRTVLRSGELPAQALAQGMPTRQTQVILHPSDTVQSRLAVPPLAAARLGAAVRALVEPMVLSAPDDLAIGHGPRRADGMLEVAWSARAPLARAWSMLADAGLQVTGIYPACHIAPQITDSDSGTDMHATPALALPADERWRHPAPDWSLALPELRPAAQGDGRWRMPAIYGAAAALVWIVGLNMYAGQLSREVRQVNLAMQHQVTQAFPTIGIVIDPVKQARQRRDSLRAGQGDARDDDFIPLAQAAASLLPQAAHRVDRLDYRDGTLSLRLDDDDAEAVPDGGPMQRATAMGLALSREENGWRLARLEASGAPASRPAAQGGAR